MSTQKSNQNLIWIDLEMTGLDPDKERIIEIATIITDSNLTIVAEGPNLVINQPKELIEKMDDGIPSSMETLVLLNQSMRVVFQSKLRR